MSLSTLERTKNRPAREQALIRAATKLFAYRGYDPTTTRDIAALAGCAEGLIHRYFNGKAGLLLAIVHLRMAQEVSDLSQNLRPAEDLHGEVLQLVEWELDRMWEDREFLNIAIPRAILEPSIGQIINNIGPRRRADVIAKRLRNFRESERLTSEQLQAIADFIGTAAFIFGYMRPAVLRQNRKHSKKVALTITELLLQSMNGKSSDHSPHVPLPALIPDLR
ncbi:MAG TPA: helix-turn-helix domain-containing protein [Terriglobales bacterium]|jgi:AcrR family transcriptional regulator